ncbi:hypothetical protein [Micromonospora sp. 067-2]|uniref:hypothetical protein n=1 Tax=Micromonospora sp. 067-2 TaxID=2789270 RepID=UPI00397DDF06
MVRTSSCASEAVEMVDRLAPGVPSRFPISSGDGREQLLDVLRADGLRYRAGARWRTAR